MSCFTVGDGLHQCDFLRLHGRRRHAWLIAGAAGETIWRGAHGIRREPGDLPAILLRCGHRRRAGQRRTARGLEAISEIGVGLGAGHALIEALGERGVTDTGIRTEARGHHRRLEFAGVEEFTSERPSAGESHGSQCGACPEERA